MRSSSVLYACFSLRDSLLLVRHSLDLHKLAQEQRDRYVIDTTMKVVYVSISVREVEDMAEPGTSVLHHSSYNKYYAVRLPDDFHLDASTNHARLVGPINRKIFQRANAPFPKKQCK